MSTSFELSKLEQQDNDDTIQPDGAAWLAGYHAQREADTYADAYTPGGVENTPLLSAPEKFPADVISSWDAGAQEARDDFTGSN